MKPELQKRLVKFSASIIWLAKGLSLSFAMKHLYSQLVRSATSAALNYGEAQTAESKNDFIHKLGIVIKELKETEVNLEILIAARIVKDKKSVSDSLKECNELIAIFSATRKTAKRNRGD